MKEYKFFIKKNLKYFLLFPIAFSYQLTFPQDSTSIAFTKVFYKMDKSALGSFKYNYGANYLIAASGTYALVKSGLDMKWEKMSSNNKWVANSGMSAAVLGGLVPLALPLGSYFYGRSNGDKDLQVAGLAMGQAAILGLAISSGIKVFTGRRAPGILDGADTIKSDYSGDFAFGFLRRGAFQGWPSSHTTIAFAMATTLTELYPDNTLLKIGSFAYAAFIGIGVSTNIHWFSDAFAGAFIGYAIGKSVGSEFNQLMSHPGKQQPYRVYATVNSIGIIYNF